MSKIREQFAAPPPPPPEAPLADEPTGDLLPYVIFTQLKANGPFIYAGWLEAADDEMAMAFAKEHYGQDQKCVNVMAIRRGHITSSDGLYEEETGDRRRETGERPKARSPLPTARSFCVFTQKNAGDLWLEAGRVEAATPHAAIDEAKRSIKMAQNAHATWVVDERDVTSTHDELVWRHTDQSYRLAKGYGREVRAKWIAFRSEAELAQYEKDDLQDAF